MALKIYLYRAEGIVASDLQPLLAAGANPVVGTTLAPSLVAITVDESHKSDLDDAMASLDYEFDAEYTGGDTLVGRQDFGTLPADPTSPSPATGDTYYNSTLGYTLVYNGTAWVADHGDQPLGDGLDHAVATDTVAGFMSPEDKDKLDKISPSAAPPIMVFGQATAPGGNQGPETVPPQPGPPYPTRFFIAPGFDRNIAQTLATGDPSAMISPRDGRLQNMYVVHNTASAASEIVEYQVFINGIDTGTALKVQLALDAGAGAVASNLVDSVDVDAGDVIIIIGRPLSTVQGNAAMDVVVTLEHAGRP